MSNLKDLVAMAKVSVESDCHAQMNGYACLWWWREGGKPNLKMETNKPLWQILDEKQIYLLYGLERTISIPESLLITSFHETNPTPNRDK